jgi:hypothetical protein
MTAEQDALITFEEDELISAETTNANNRYLESKISDNATSITNYVDRELATLENELEGDITSAQTTLQQNINNLSTRIDGIKFFPNYSSGIAQSVNTEYTATQDGWVFMYAMCYNAQTVYYYINGSSYVLCGSVNNDTDTAASGIWFPVKSGDKYKLGSAGIQSYSGVKFFPMRG